MMLRLRPIFFTISCLLCVAFAGFTLFLAIDGLTGWTGNLELVESFPFFAPPLVLGLIVFCEIQLFFGRKIEYHRPLGWFWFTIGGLCTAGFVIAVLDFLDTFPRRFDDDAFFATLIFGTLGGYGLLCGAIRAFGRKPVLPPRGFVVGVAPPPA